VAAMPRAVCL